MEVVSDVRDIDFSDDVWVIGGAEIYRLFLHGNFIDEMYLTEIHKELPGDAFFPDFSKSEWVEVEREFHEGFSFVTLRPFVF